METTHTELSIEETIKLLQSQKDTYSSCNDKNRSRMEKLLDDLIGTAVALDGQSLEDKILIGSLFEVELNYDDGAVELGRYYLGLDYSADTISILSPLGYSIFGNVVGQTVSYDVKIDTRSIPLHVEARLLGKNNNLAEEKSHEKLLVNN